MRGKERNVPTVGVFAAIVDDDERILCVRRDYGDHAWTIPGGGMEPREAPIEALIREVREETGYEVEVGSLIGVYSMPWKDDLVLCFQATIVSRGPWSTSGEIAEVGFFPFDGLPQPFSRRARCRINDLRAPGPCLVRVLDPD
jgi:ADP-ribose pyrophosphatase YjhB (NUDIX family)